MEIQIKGDFPNTVLLKNTRFAHHFKNEIHRYIKSF